MKIINLTQNTILADDVIVADSFFSRIKGLLGRPSLGANQALVIKSCQQVHTFFMRFPIDVIFLDKSNKVVGVVENLSPFRLSPIFFSAKACIELAASAIPKSRTKINDVISLK